jgi:membrane protein DedA with SNARE-associated domain
MSGLASGSMWAVLAWLVAGGLGAPLPEDVALLATGAMIERGVIDPIAGFAFVICGVLAGDAVLFFGARRLGAAALQRRPFARLLPPARRAKLARAYERRGGLVVFVARNVVGLRAAAFAMAGIAGMRARRFFAWDAAAACIGVPIWLAIGYAGAHHVVLAR